MATCYKCKAQYESADASDLAGDGYCLPCKEAKNAIAAQIDVKMANRPREVKPLIEYDITQTVKDGITITTYRDKLTSQILGRR